MDGFDRSEVSNYLMYLVVNHLYDWAMTQYLPYGGFTWTSTDIDFNVEDDSQVGYILEVDLDYPSHLHVEHKDLPFCPEQSKRQGGKDYKSLKTFYPKMRYIIDYRNLKQDLKSGLN